LLIADGHHRYETALNYRRARRHENASSNPEPYDYTMMTLVGCNDPGLVILADASRCEDARSRCDCRVPERAREIFKVEEIAHRDEFRARLERAGSGAIGVTLRGSSTYFILRLRSRTALKAAMPDAPTPVRRLDVSVVHALIFIGSSGSRRTKFSAATISEYTIETGAHSCGGAGTRGWCVPDESAVDRGRRTSK